MEGRAIALGAALDSNASRESALFHREERGRTLLMGQDWKGPMNSKDKYLELNAIEQSDPRKGASRI